MGAAEFRLLGPTQVLVDSEPVELPKKQLAVLVVLLLHAGQVVSRDRIIEDLWPELDRDAGHNNLRVQLSALRKALRVAGITDLIVTRSPGYVVQIERDSVDLHRFSALLRSASDTIDVAPDKAAGLIDEALALWHGDPIADFAYDDFAQTTIRSLCESHLRCRELRFTAATAVGRGPETIPEIEAFVDEHPLREHAHRDLMMAYHQAGRQAEALRTYERARSVLVETAGLDPIPELAELRDQILAQDPGLSVAASRPETDTSRAAPIVDPRLLRYASGFVGRIAELEELSRRVRPRSLVTVVGPGGCGKTRLLSEFSQSLTRDVGDIVRFVDLARVERDRPILGLVAEELGLEEAGPNPLATIKRHLRSDPQLLILDNCEHVIANTATLANALLELPHLAIVATSREPLGVDGEVLLRIAGLSTDSADDMSEAGSLFVERGRSAAGDWAPDSADLETVERLCRHLDGIPLAIEMAAARLRHMSLTDVERRLVDRFEFLEGGLRTVRARHQTLRATLDWSAQLLEPDEMLVFSRLSVFRGSFTPEAAAAVCNDDTIPAAAVDRILWRLVDRSLITRPDIGSEGRLRLLETIGEYARQELDADRSAIITDRFVAWATDFVTEAGAGLRSDASADAMDLVDSEVDNLLHAARLSLANHDPSFVMWMADRLEDFIISRELLESETLELLEDALTIDNCVDDEVRANAAVTASFLAFGAGQHDQATAHATAAAKLASAASLPRTEANAYINLGTVRLHVGDLSGARSAYRNADAIGEHLDDSRWQARNKVHRASTEAPRKQLALMEEAAGPIHSSGSQLLKGYHSIQYGWFFYGLGLVEEASTQFARAAALYTKDIGGAEALAEVHWGLADLALWQNRMELAREHIERALDLATEIHWGVGTALALSRLLQLEGTGLDPEALITKAETNLDPIRHPVASARLLQLRADQARRAGDAKPAIDIAAAAAQGFADMGLTRAAAYATKTKAVTLSDAGQPNDARAAIAEAAAAFAGSGKQPVVIDGLRCPDVAGLFAEVEVYRVLADMGLASGLEPAIRSAASESHSPTDRISSLSGLRQTVADLIN